MKELYLVRRAKSDWSDMDINDIDRPLKARGIRDALLMGEFMAKEFNVPDLVLTSPACRAFHTAVIFIRSLKAGYDKVRVDEEIYLASFNELRSLIKKTSDTIEKLMLVGHNPGLTDMANFFLDEFIHNIPTSGFVTFQFDTGSWKGISSGNLINHTLHYPKEFMMF